MTEPRYEGPITTDPDHLESGHDFDEVIPAEAEGLAGVVLFSVALALIVVAPFATRLPPADKAWYLAPINWPLLSLGMAAIAGAIMAWRFAAAWRADGGPGFRTRALWAFGGFRGALEYSAWFCLYLVGVSLVGFGIATLVFLQYVVWRSGLRGRTWMLTALGVAVAIIVIFRLGVGLWFPLAPLFKLFPAWVGNMLGGVL